MANNRQTLPGRIEASLVTGPLGHLISAVADWAVLLSRLAAERLRRAGGSERE